MLQLSDKTLKRSLQTDGLQKIYLIAGNDEFLLNACAKAVLGAVFADGERYVVLFDAAAASDEELEEFFLSFSLVSTAKAALFEDFSAGALSAQRAELLHSLFLQLPDDITVVLREYVEEDNRRFAVPKKSLQLLDGCRRSAVVTATAKAGGELSGYIAAIAKQAGCTIDDRAADRVGELCAGDLLLAENEIGKLAALSGYGEIRREHVDTLCVRTPEAGVFDMIGAIERGDAKKAMAVLADMLDERTEPLAVTGALNTAFINLYRARLARDSRRGEQALFDLFNYKKNDRKVSIAYERSARYTERQLAGIIELLYGLDKKLKSTAADKRFVLEQGVVRLMAKAGAL
ncbi:MAG: DNA polymerase III subunit delta [Oscillospiraceae bacterium]|nr:DNA polymerase III subunit delta [Oscillospiraceae bacterium]